MSAITKSPSIRRSLAERLVDPVEIDLIDGVRLVCQDGSIVHFRRSGNAPEFRCYVETSDREDTRQLLGIDHARARGAFRRARSGRANLPRAISDDSPGAKSDLTYG